MHFRQQDFYLALFAGTAVSVFGILNLDGLCRLLGSTENNFTICKNICILCFAFCTGNGDRLCNEQYFCAMRVMQVLRWLVWYPVVC